MNEALNDYTTDVEKDYKWLEKVEHGIVEP